MSWPSPHSIRFRLLGWFGAVALAAFLAFGCYTYLAVRHYLRAAQLATLTKRAQRIGDTLLRPLDATGEAYVGREIEARFSPEADDRFIRVLRPDGTVLYLSGPPLNESFDPGEIPLPASRVTAPRSWEAAFPGGVCLLISSLPYPVGGKTYLVEAGGLTSYRDEVLRGLVRTLGIGLPVLILVAVGGGYLLIVRALRPVTRITRAAQRITLSNLSLRLPVDATRDELEQLSVTLNEMIARLDESFRHASRFSMDAAHELRTPLAIVRGELEEALAHPDLDPALRDGLESVQEEVTRLTRIVEGLFTISNLETGGATLDVNRFDLARLAATTAEQMTPLAGDRDIALASAAATAVPVQGDRFRIKQVVVNLLDNAIKYTPPGGRIWLAVRREGREAVLEVDDTGPGIPAAALPHVFDRFYRAEDARANGIAGAGLGLAIVRSICLAHGGEIEAGNRPEGGARFRVRLPLHPEAGG